MKTAYNFSRIEVERLRAHIFASPLMSVPEGFLDTEPDILRRCYNGIGPDHWSSRFRKITTWLLTFLEASALIHDWEYTFQPKTYGAFTRANLRLARNAAVDGYLWAGLAAGFLCQLFGWSGYQKTTHITMKG